MGFKQIKLIPSYNTSENDVVNEFYVPVLSKAVKYLRVSAYFSSKVFANLATGLFHFARNNGKMKLIISEEITEEDFTLIKSGYYYKTTLNDRLIKQLNEPTDEVDRIKLANVAYLIANDLLDIKIAFKKEGTFHDKFGLFYDNENNIIYYRGSNNETEAALKYNYEAFEITCDWLSNEFDKQKIYKSIDMFNKMWNNELPDVQILDVPTVVKNELIKFYDGEIKDETKYKNETITLDYIDGYLIGYSLKIHEYFDENSRNYKILLRRHVKSIDSLSIIFKTKENFNEIINLIKKIELYMSKDHPGIVVRLSKSLLRYLEEHDYKFKERKQLGIYIKNHDESLLPEFNAFCTIVNHEMERRLKESQLWSAFHIICMIKSANYSVPGTGKTSVVYGAFAYLNSPQINKVQKLLVIGPKHSFKSWIDEFYLNFGDKKKLRLFSIADVKRKDRRQEIMFGTGGKNLILINYEILPSIKNELKSIIDDTVMVVFDESHKIKSLTGIRAKVSQEIVQNAYFTTLLTGTPIPNGYEDLYTSLKIMFKNDYKYYIGFTPSELKQLNGYSEDSPSLQQFNNLIYPFYIRTTKQELKVPKANDDHIIPLSLTPAEIELIYKVIYRYYDNVLTLYIRLVQALSHPKSLLSKINKHDLLFLTDVEFDGDSDSRVKNIRIDDEVQYDIDDVKLINQISTSTKIQTGVKLIQNLVNEGKSVLAWALFIDTLYKIEEELTKLGISSRVICGQVELLERESIIEEFKSGKIQVLIANPQTLAESVSLHMICHDAVYFEYSFNLTHMLQSRDRIHRLGLKPNQETNYYYLIPDSKDIPINIDQITYERLKDKEQRMINAIEGTQLLPLRSENIQQEIKEILNKIISKELINQYNK